MRSVLTAIQDGSFAREWIAEMDSGSAEPGRAPRASSARRRSSRSGKRLRALGHREVQEAHGVG